MADPRVITLEHTPSLAVLFARAALTSLRPAGQDKRGAGVGGGAGPAAGAHDGAGVSDDGDSAVTGLEDVEVRQRGVRIDLARLAAYDRVCGFPLREVLPPTYLHVLAFPLQMALMTEPGFPLPLPGLVHIRNSIVVHRPVTANEVLSLTSTAESLGPAATGAQGTETKGAQVRLVSQARVEEELVWEGASTYLSRGASVPGTPEPGQRPQRQPQPGPPQQPRSPLRVDLPSDATARAVWPVPADLGRRYAAVSGDVNPIHLSFLAARAFGFRRALAHGMWTKAHALAAIEPRLPPGYAVDVELGKPLFLPSVVNLVVAARGTGWDFAVRPRGRAGDHLRGTVRPL